MDLKYIYKNDRNTTKFIDLKYTYKNDRNTAKFYL